MKPIVVVGSLNMDLVVRAPRLPAAGETVTGESLQTFAGGKGANQAVAAARLGSPVAMIGAVGQDSFGQELRQGLRAEGVDLAALGSAEGVSGVAVIQVEPGGENRITVVAGANGTVKPERLETHRPLLAGAAMVLTQLEIPLVAVERLAEICEELRVPLMLDPAPVQPLPPELLRRCTWLTPNLREARLLLGHADAGEPTVADACALAEALLALGPRNVALKLGAQGAVVCAAGAEPLHVPAFPADAVDTTAAGDCWNAALAVALCRGDTVAEAARFASAAAALSVGREGAQPSLPGLDEVLRAMQEPRDS